MKKLINIPTKKPSRLERFGLFYLNLFKRLDSDHSVFNLTDIELEKRIKKLLGKVLFLVAL